MRIVVAIPAIVLTFAASGAPASAQNAAPSSPDRGTVQPGSSQPTPTSRKPLAAMGQGGGYNYQRPSGMINGGAMMGDPTLPDTAHRPALVSQPPGMIRDGAMMGNSPLLGETDGSAGPKPAR